MTLHDSHRPDVGQLADACRQNGLDSKQVWEQLFEPVDDAHLKCIAAEVTQA
jgi:hypothetical protein